MFNFNVGALRPATDAARPDRLRAATDLVGRTLAQHGLTSGPVTDGAPFAPLPSLSLPKAGGLFAGLQRQTQHPRPEPTLPTGAVFRNDVHTGPEGSRAFRTYVPASAARGVSGVPASAARGVSGVVVMLHGCTQGPEDFASGTGMNALAERHRLVVVYPHQSRGENAQSCWNWFRRGDQRRDRGEPAIIAGIARALCAEFGVPRDRTFIAGLSAGAAMAVILGETYGDVFAAVGAHSGLPFGAAVDVPSAFAAMAGRGGVAQAPPGAGGAVRTIVFHGTADTTVHPSNGSRIATDAARHGPDQTVEDETQERHAGRTVQRRVSSGTDGQPHLETWTVEGLGHAWSGGQPEGSYTDPAGPDASAEMIRFFLSTPEKSS